MSILVLLMLVSGILAAPNAGQSQQCPGPKSADSFPRRAVIQLVEAASSNFLKNLLIFRMAAPAANPIAEPPSFVNPQTCPNSSYKNIFLYSSG